MAMRRKNIINVISLVSMIAIAGGTMALVILLSAFNGIEGLVVSMMNTFDTPLKIEAVAGKHFPTDSTKIAALKEIPEVLQVVEVIEDNALSEYNNRQHIVRVKGVSSNYQTFSTIDSMMIDGQFLLEQNQIDCAVLGAGVWYYLGVNIRDLITPLALIAPTRTASNVLGANNFTRLTIFPSGVFSIQQELDEKYVLVPLRFAQDLFDYDSLRSYYEVWTHNDNDAAKIKQTVADFMGDEFRVLDRYEQQKTIYKIMRTEKWAMFLILIFIVLVASFNMISSISMLIIDKQEDMYILNAMGTRVSKVKKIFLWQGLLQAFAGCLVGIALGLLLCFLQMKFGIIALGSDGGTFAIDHYPIVVQFWDIVYVFLSIIAIGLLTSLVPVLKINSKFLSRESN